VGGWEAWLLWGARFALAGVLLLVGASDLRSRRIPNRLVGAGLAIALLWHAVAPAGSGLFDRHDPGALGLAASAVGAAAAFAAFLLLHLTRAMGAGDVKLMAMLGAVFGLGALPSLALAVFAVGGLLVVARLFDRERRRAVAGNLLTILVGRIAAVTGASGPRFDPSRDTADRLPFGLAIAGGAMLLAVLQWQGTVG